MTDKRIEEILALDLGELMSRALAEKLKHRGAAFSRCSIINAKSGHCSEDCRFCAQSGHYRTDAPVYPLKGGDEVLFAAEEAKRIGADRFSMVTSGRGMGRAEVDLVAEMVARIRKEVGIKVCVSLGILALPELTVLKDAGASRYHHNLESSREYFPRVCSTHTFDDRLATIKAAHEAGLEVCSGGIFGLGESEADRVSMALTLLDCRVESVPLNILIPLPGTPMAGTPPLSKFEILRAVAIYRLILPAVPIRFAGGREVFLEDFLSLAFMAGMDGLMIGGYLTQAGRPPEKDNLFREEMIGIWQDMLPG